MKVDNRHINFEVFVRGYHVFAQTDFPNVFTSKDGIIWNQDAKYFYYLHGSLARTELGELI